MYILVFVESLSLPFPAFSASALPRKGPTQECLKHDSAQHTKRNHIRDGPRSSLSSLRLFVRPPVSPCQEMPLRISLSLSLLPVCVCEEFRPTLHFAFSFFKAKNQQKRKEEKKKRRKEEKKKRRKGEMEMLALLRHAQEDAALAEDQRLLIIALMFHSEMVCVAEGDRHGYRYRRTAVA